MFRQLAVSCLLLAVGNICFAQGIEDFALKRGIGIRAAGMGGAYTAIADDASAVFYNPAGLAVPGFAYTFGDPDTGNRDIDGSFELVKLGYVGYGSWSMKNAEGDEISTTAVGFGNRSGWLNWGMNYKGVNWTLSGTEGEGGSSDIGFLLRITPQFNIGILAQDVLTSKSFIVPASGRLGIGYKPLGEKLTLAGDIEIDRSSQCYGHFGLDVNIIEGFSIRGGLDRGEVTAGLTLDLFLFSFDYAALFHGNGQATQRFEAGVKVFPGRERPFSIIKPKEYALIDISGAIKGGSTEYSFLGGLRPGLDSIYPRLGEHPKTAASMEFC